MRIPRIDLAFLSRELGKIDRQAPIDEKIEDLNTLRFIEKHENIKIEKDENVFIQIKLLNDIRRILTEKLISMREKSNINFESCD